MLHAGQAEPGEQGPPGTAGEPGDPGTAGGPGLAGAAGATGDQGVNGTSGAPGLQGTAGDQGINGTAGPQGFNGTAGSYCEFGLKWLMRGTFLLECLAGGMQLNCWGTHTRRRGRGFVFIR